LLNRQSQTLRNPLSSLRVQVLNAISDCNVAVDKQHAEQHRLVHANMYAGVVWLLRLPLHSLLMSAPTVAPNRCSYQDMDWLHMLRHKKLLISIANHGPYRRPVFQKL
jgi:hypothetical protein